MVRPELPDRIQMPPDFNRPLLPRLFLGLANRPPHRAKIESSPQHDARSERHFRVSDILPRQRFDHPPRDQSVIFRAAQSLRDELETREETRKISKSPDLIDNLARHGGIEQHQGFAVDGTLEMQVKLASGHNRG